MQNTTASSIDDKSNQSQTVKSVYDAAQNHINLIKRDAKIILFIGVVVGFITAMMPLALVNKIKSSLGLIGNYKGIDNVFAPIVLIGIALGVFIFAVCVIISDSMCLMASTAEISIISVQNSSQTLNTINLLIEKSKKKKSAVQQITLSADTPLKNESEAKRE